MKRKHWKVGNKITIECIVNMKHKKMYGTTKIGYKVEGVNCEHLIFDSPRRAFDHATYWLIRKAENNE
ncbi:MAG: hypothetical protein R3321_04905 [Nitrososphaeraceae archaeon]|nr:hypothetical protein [Nitrososphaeraceae archaeon]